MKYLITRRLENIILFFDGERFQTEANNAMLFSSREEAETEAYANDLIYHTVEPVSSYYNGAGFMLNQIFPS